MPCEMSERRSAWTKNSVGLSTETVRTAGEAAPSRDRSADGERLLARQAMGAQAHSASGGASPNVVDDDDAAVRWVDGDAGGSAWRRTRRRR